MLEPGLYDQLITTALAARLDERAVTGPLDDAEAPSRYAAHLGQVLATELPDLEPDARHRIVVELLRSLAANDEAPTYPPQLLTGIAEPNLIGELTLPAPPDVPLSQHDLLVNARGEPQLASELKREIASADGVDLIVAFVRWYGVRLLFEELEQAMNKGVPVRLLTTTYTGSTERQALDRLAELGVDIRVSYDTAVTRLHAKPTSSSPSSSCAPSSRRRSGRCAPSSQRRSDRCEASCEQRSGRCGPSSPTSRTG